MITQYRYDAMNRVLCTAIRMNTAVYNALPADACAQSGLAPFATDRIAETIYDETGQVLEQWQGVGTSFARRFVAYEYWPNGQKKSVRDADNNLTSLAYDGFDRLKVQTFPFTGRASGLPDPTDVETYAYDDNGDRTSLTTRSGQAIGFYFDVLARMASKQVPNIAGSDVLNVTYKYDLAGRPTLVSYAGTNKSVGYIYDTAGRQTDETTYGWDVHSVLDAAGNRTQLVWPDGIYANYIYDAANQLTLIGLNGATTGSDVLATFTYDNLGRRSVLTRGNGGSATYQYDTGGRLQHLVQSGGSGQPVSDQTLGYNPASQLVQLIQVSSNFVWNGHPTSTTNHTYNGLNQDSAVAALANGYDANGNLTSDGVRTMSYSAENRLLQESSASSSMSALYDPTGRLASITETPSPGVSTPYWFLYDGDRLIAEYAASELTTGSPTAAPLRRYVHGDGVDEPLIWFEGGGTTDRRWLHADHQGSIIGYSDASGVVTAYTYGPYGEPSDWSGPRFRYTGQIVFPLAQLYHYKGRVYDPMSGRFLQTDPIGQKDDPDLYAYVSEDPIDKSDPTGLAEFDPNRIKDPEQKSAAMAINNAMKDNKGRVFLAGDRSISVNKGVINITAKAYGSNVSISGKVKDAGPQVRGVDISKPEIRFSDKSIKVSGEPSSLRLEQTVPPSRGAGDQIRMVPNGDFSVSKFLFAIPYKTGEQYGLPQ